MPCSVQKLTALVFLILEIPYLIAGNRRLIKAALLKKDHGLFILLFMINGRRNFHGNILEFILYSICSMFFNIDYIQDRGQKHFWNIITLPTVNPIGQFVDSGFQHCHFEGGVNFCEMEEVGRPEHLNRACYWTEDNLVWLDYLHCFKHEWIRCGKIVSR